MTPDVDSVESAEAALRATREAVRVREPFTDQAPDLDADWAYAVQALDLRHRRAAGEQLVGAKLGLTSEAKQRRMNVDQPVVGFLTDPMLLRADQVGAALDGWNQPRIEPEIAFRTCAPIDRPVTAEQARRLVDGVTAGAEILDSRYAGYRFGFADVVADNTSAAGVVLAAWRDPASIGDLGTVGCRVVVDDVEVHRATGAAVLGDPWRALEALSIHVAARGEVLPSGSIVLAGALTDAVPLERGHHHVLDLGVLGRVVVPT